MIKPIVIAVVATAAVFGTTAAQAGGVSWSVSIDAPVVFAQPVAAPGYHDGRHYDAHHYDGRYQDGRHYDGRYRTEPPAFERGYRVAAQVPRYDVLAAPQVVAAPVYMRPAPVIVAAPLPVPVYYAQPFRHGHRAEVIVVPTPRWRHHHAWHDDRGFDRGFGRGVGRGVVHYGDR